jgi:hypothetical protein
MALLTFPTLEVTTIKYSITSKERRGALFCAGFAFTTVTLGIAFGSHPNPVQDIIPEN